MIKETDKQGNTKYQYVKCPACGSKKRHYERISAEAIKAGTVGPEFLIPFQHDSRLVVESIKEATLPVGSEVPSIMAATEICMDCGCVYAPMVIIGKAKKSITTKGQEKPKLYLLGQR